MRGCRIPVQDSGAGFRCRKCGCPRAALMSCPLTDVWASLQSLKIKKKIHVVGSSFTGCTSVPLHQHHSVSCLWFSSSLKCNLQPSCRVSACVRACERELPARPHQPSAATSTQLSRVFPALLSSRAVTCPRFNGRCAFKRTLSRSGCKRRCAAGARLQLRAC